MPRSFDHPGAGGAEHWGGGPWAFRDPDRSWGPSRRLRLWVPVFLSAVIQIPAAVWLVKVTDPDFAVAVATVSLAVVGPVALIGARRFPGPVAAVATAAALGSLLVGAGGGPPPIALAFALIGAIVRGARLWAWLSLALGWAVALAAGLVVPTAPWHPARVVGTTLGLLLVMGIGEAIRSRRERIREYRAAAARRRLTAAEEERMRIARELHDVLAHSLSQINVQAGVGLHLAEAHPDKAAEALAAIKSTSKTALDDVRAVLGVLRADGDDAPRAPQPGVEAIAGLVRGTEIPGAVIDFHGIDDTDVAAPIGAAAYRIVQEALTNVTRHGADVTRVTVALNERDGLIVEVSDDGSPSLFEPGRGLLGMRERVELLGGRFHVSHDGGFTVRAEFPRKEPA